VTPTAAPHAEWPRISIVIPSFNHREYLEQAIRSVLDQQYPGLDLIVIDGASTDGSRELIAQYGARLSYWVSEPDRGPADALRKGFARATGEVFGFLNADDFLLPDALATIGKAFAADRAADVIAGHGYFATPSGELALPAYSDRWHPRRFVDGGCVLLQPATYFRRAAFERAGGIRRTGRVCWDMELWADLSRSGAVFRSIDAFLAAFRLHPQSITGGTGMAERRRLDARAVMAEIRGRPETAIDRARHLLQRLSKFARHPVRTIRQRLFFRRTLRRWSL
jgi:glycosyltransferase involved in cell wall biosynthesis